ncbi:hypothetical protein B0J11DRAFT_535167, partial [Dendryphion nanum]
MLLQSRGTIHLSFSSSHFHSRRVFLCLLLLLLFSPTPTPRRSETRQKPYTSSHPGPRFLFLLIWEFYCSWPVPAHVCQSDVSQARCTTLGDRCKCETESGAGGYYSIAILRVLCVVRLKINIEIGHEKGYVDVDVCKQRSLVRRVHYARRFVGGLAGASIEHGSGHGSRVRWCRHGTWARARVAILLCFDRTSGSGRARRRREARRPARAEVKNIGRHDGMD